MGSIADVDTAGTCDTCGWCTEGLEDLQRRAGDNLCPRCDALFTAAHALLDNGIPGEAAILGTLAFAWSEGTWTTSSEDYGGLELLTIADGVPVLKPPDITAGVVSYDDSHIAKAVKIDVYSQRVTPEKLAETYRELLESHKIHFEKC